MKRLKIFTWHVHGAYLFYLSHIDHDIYIPAGDGRLGKVGAIANRGNVYEIPVERIRHSHFDCILFQSKDAYVQDQYKIFSEQQLELPKIYLEHDPPREHPTDTKHFVDKSDFLVHVTHYNSLMWESSAQSQVIEHAVLIPELLPVGGNGRGITVINNLRNRGRRLGCDLFLKARSQTPIDLIGMDAQSLGGLGEIFFHELPSFLSHYRYFFHPVRYTSLALALLEGMSVGLPVIGLATTELPAVIQNNYSGYLSNNLDDLIFVIEELNQYPQLARQWGQAARRVVEERFNIHRFVREWNDLFNLVAG